MSSANTSSEANRDDGCEWYFGVPFPSKRAQATAPATQERELKVGDRVEVNVDRYPVKAGRGRRGKIKEVLSHGYTVRLDNSDDGFEWFFYPGDCNLLPPTFATNTRVRLKRHVHRFAAGDMGTVTTSNDENVGVRMDEGRYWAFKPEDLQAIPSPWNTPAPDCAGRKEQQEAKLKFKAGDVVTYKDQDETPSSARTIKGAYTRCLWSKEPAIEYTDGGWDFESNLVLAPANDPATPCIVMRLDNGQPRPSSWPHVHQSAADAIKEAERLASVNPGKQFDVYQRVTGRVGDVQVREVA